MYKFIKEIKDGYTICEEECMLIEREFGFRMPKVLLEYYKRYNGARIALCRFEVNGYDYEVSEILPLKYGGCCLEEIVRNDREDGIIPHELIPLANNRGGDYYYWDMSTGKVYFIYCDDIENPIQISESIEAFLETMEAAC